MAGWFVLAMAAPLFWAASNVVDRAVVGGRRLSPLGATAFSGASGLVILATVPWLTPLRIAAPDATMLLALLCGLVYGAATLCYFVAMRAATAALNAMALQLVLGLTVLLSHVFLDERLAAPQYAGVGCFLLATLAMTFRRRSVGPDIAIAGACLGFALATVLSKHVLGRIAFLPYLVLSEAGVLCVALGSLLAALRRANDREALGAAVRVPRGVLALPLLSEGANLVGLLLERAALIEGPASLVTSVACVQPLFVVALLAMLRRRGLPTIDAPWSESWHRLIPGVALAAAGSFLVLR